VHPSQTSPRGALIAPMDQRKDASESPRWEIEVEPDVAPLAELLGLLDEFKIWFNVIEP
jgi:alkyl sulfatase BDS1-like metallo-beta-lactamase superfamily hydrolase